MIAALSIAAGIVAGLALAAFFAACEGAFFQLSPPSDRDAVDPGARPSRAGRLLARQDRLQSAIELGHLLGVVWVAGLAWELARLATGGRPGPLGLLITIPLVGFLVVVVAELVPKALGMGRAAAWAERASPVVAAWQTVLTPVIALGAALGRLTERCVPAASPVLAVESDELRTIVAESTEQSDLELGERQMITSIFAFGETTVREVMTPRTDVVAIESTTPVEAVIEGVRESEHSRVPIFEKSLDRILGVVYAKDLLAIVHGLSEPPRRLSEILWPATFVPEAKRIDDLLRQFQREEIHMAVVVDEYGGTAGIVTLEDILEELVGEIQDEYDQEEPMVVPLERGVLRLDGRLDADDFNELTGSRLEAEEVETMGGLVARELARVAEGGETVEIGDWVFEVETVEGHRIVRLLAWPREETAVDERGNGR